MIGTSSSPTPPAVSVVVPVRDDPHRLGRCLAALAASDFGSFDVWVVDDASTSQESIRVAEAAGATVVRMSRNVGPAAARNAGARAAGGDVIHFVDADCLVHADSVSRVAGTLAAGTPWSAVFGSYDTDPDHPAFISRWKNLSHRFTHQMAREEAGTFWCGCGAVRRDVFLAAGGFDEHYGRPCIEDIEFGMRLIAAGHRIRLDKDLQVKHLKRWRMGNLIRTDILDRGLPWTRLLLADGPQGRPKIDDLNVSKAQKIAALASAGLVAGGLIAGWWWPALWLAAIATALGTLLLDTLTARGGSRRWVTPVVGFLVAAGLVALAFYATLPTLMMLGVVGLIVAINRRFYGYLRRQEGAGFAVAAVMPHVVYYLCALTGYGLGLVLHILRPRLATSPGAADSLARSAA